jgi:hypothetical protein
MRMLVSVLALSAACAAGQSTFSASASFGPPPPFGMPAVTGAPYSAEEISEHLQVLADGTRISRTMPATKVYRDSNGRTRRERPMFMGAVESKTPSSPLIVEIEDPVAEAKYVLDAANLVAHRQALPRFGTRGFTTPRAAPPRNNMPPPRTNTEDLGTQTIEGILVEGRRTTTVVAAGAIGNDRPIASTHDNWSSPELKIIVLSKSSDPRSGEHTRKLVNISRAEPDPALFQVPPGYTVVEETGEFTVRWNSPR